jgi:hypothetical protein
MSKAASSNSLSYYDWELTFKRKSKSNLNNQTKEVNSLGLSDENFKDFMTNWKKRNLT